MINLKYIKLRRKELGFTLQDMAETFKFSDKSNYLKYEHGDYQFKADMLPILADKLQCKIENFFT